MTDVCAICGGGPMRAGVGTPRLAVVRCADCGHCAGEHASDAAVAATDYHEQYEQYEGGDGFVEALARTRRRQSGRIVALIRQVLPEVSGIVDFGAGRGWFLEGAREAGVPRLAGVDASNRAVELLRRSRLEGALVRLADGRLAELPSISFRPDVLTLLDVVEHLPPREAAATLTRVVAHYRPKLVVVKVPSNGGILYAAARALASVGVVGPLEQLYQVGSHPPHYSYFSRRSLGTLLARCGLSALVFEADLDFEPEELARRARIPRALGLLARPLGAVAGAAANALAAQDSLIVVARVSAAAPP